MAKATKKPAKRKKAGPRPDTAEPKRKKAAKAKVGPKPKPKKKARKLPLPAALPRPSMPVAAKVDPAASALAPFSALGGPEILDALWRTVETRRLVGDVEHSHSARLLARGTAKVAQKLGEEAVECVIEATQGNRGATILESADLLYHLVVVWVDAGIRPDEVWAELARRQGISGVAEKAARPKGILRSAQTTKLP